VKSPAKVLLPQHAIDPLVLIAQVCKYPASTDVNVPLGALVTGESASPQHVIVPVVWTAQAWLSPTAMLEATIEGSAAGGAPPLFTGGGAAAAVEAQINQAASATVGRASLVHLPNNTSFIGASPHSAGRQPS
jgi:hypothetical protein